MKNLTFLLLLATFLGISACGPATVESETSRWNSNKERINRLKANYTKFSGVLDKVLADADAAMKSAESISSEEEKIKAMGDANSKAAPQFVLDLDGMDKLIRSVEDLATKAKQTSGDASDTNAAYDAANRATETIRDSRNRLNTANVSDVAAANAVTDAVKKNLDGAKKRLNDVISTADKKAEDAKKAEEDAKTAADKKAEEEKKAKADIVCQYCKKSCPAGSTECPHCGGPLN